MRYAKTQKRLISVFLTVTTLVGCLCLLDRFAVTIEQLASAAPITFTVTETGDNSCANPLQRNCTLRQVIIASNNNPGLDTIRFAITGGPSAVKTISVLIQRAPAHSLTLETASSFRMALMTLLSVETPMQNATSSRATAFPGFLSSSR